METPTVDGMASSGLESTVEEAAEVHGSFVEGVVAVLRDAFRAALAAGVVGVVVLGVGGRIAMRLAALFDPAATGKLTENGNQIGAITVEGTLALLLFGGLFSGLIGAIVWVAVAPWIPGKGLRRALVVMPIAVALSSFMLVESVNPDFRILSNDPVVIAMLLGLIAAFGFVLAMSDDWLDRVLPPVARTPRMLAVVYAIAVLAGAALILPLVVGIYFSREVCGCGEPPVLLGLAVLAAGGATVVWWVARTTGSSTPPKWLMIVGGLAVLAAVVFGSLRLATDVGRILGAG